MEFEKELQVGNINWVKNKLIKIFDKNNINTSDFLEVLISKMITWHCGGMSDPFQPIENKLHITKDLIDITNKYGISILFSTKSDTTYNCDIKPELHTFQLSITNTEDRVDIEPNVPCIKKREEFYYNLKNKGFKVGIRLQPFIPNVVSLNVIETFKDADYFTIEGLKLVPQNKEHKEYLVKLFNLDLNDFKQMGLLNLKPEIRKELYKPFIQKLNEYNIPFSIADNDMHQISSGKCCCGDVLISKSTAFNSTALLNKYGIDYNLQNVYDNLEEFQNCKACHLFTSNRQEGCITVKDFYEKRFNRQSSPFSPKFLYK